MLGQLVAGIRLYIYFLRCNHTLVHRGLLNVLCWWSLSVLTDGLKSGYTRCFLKIIANVVPPCSRLASFQNLCLYSVSTWLQFTLWNPFGGSVCVFSFTQQCIKGSVSRDCTHTVTPKGSSVLTEVSVCGETASEIPTYLNAVHLWWWRWWLCSVSAWMHEHCKATTEFGANRQM